MLCCANENACEIGLPECFVLRLESDCLRLLYLLCIAMITAYCLWESMYPPVMGKKSRDTLAERSEFLTYLWVEIGWNTPANTVTFVSFCANYGAITRE